MEHKDILPSIAYFDEVFDRTQKGTKISSPLKINVIVLCMHLNSRINIATFHETWENNDSKGIFKCKYDPQSKKSSKSKNQTFYNSITLSFFYKTKKLSAKIFPTGRIVITGCRTIAFCHEIPEIIFEFIKKHFEHNPEVCQEISSDDRSLEVEKVRFCNLNTQFKFNFLIRQPLLKEIIEEKKWIRGGEWRTAIFDGNKYAAVKAYFWPKKTVAFQKTRYEEYLQSKQKKPFKIFSDKKGKVPGQVSVMIFRTGTVMLKGARNVEDLYAAYKATHKLMYEVKEMVEYESD